MPSSNLDIQPHEGSLASQMQGLTLAIHEFNQQLSVLSLNSSLQGRFAQPERLILGNAQFNLNLYFKQGSEVRFFFQLKKKKRNEEEKYIMKNEIAMTLQPFTDRMEDLRHIEHDQTEYRFNRPTFIKKREIAGKKILWVNLVHRGDNMPLGFEFEKKAKASGANLVYKGKTIKNKDLKNEEQDLLFDFILMLGQWLKKGNNEIQTLDIPENRNELESLLYQTSEAFVEVYNAALSFSNADDWSKILYLPSDFNSKAFLKLDEEGKLIRPNSSPEDTFQMMFDSQLKTIDGKPVMNVKFFPPDFLRSGEVYDALLDAAMDVKKQIAKKTKQEIPQIESLLQQARKNDSIILRINRGSKSDTNLFFLEQVGERPLIFEANVERINENGKVKFQLRNIGRLQRKNGNVKKQLIKYCSALAWQLLHVLP